MGIGTHKNDALVCLNDFAFTNALVSKGRDETVFGRTSTTTEKKLKKNEETMNKIRLEKYA